jgi:hypothetical protein
MSTHAGWYPPSPPSLTTWARRVPHPVLIGHAASVSQGTLKKTLRHAEEEWAPLGAAGDAEAMQM